MFFEAIFKYTLVVFFWFVGILGQLLFYPLQIVIFSFFPSLADFTEAVFQFLEGLIFPMLSFCKEAFLDISCTPRPLFIIMINTILLRWAIAPTVRIIKLLINVWKLAHGGATKET